MQKTFVEAYHVEMRETLQTFYINVHFISIYSSGVGWLCKKEELVWCQLMFMTLVVLNGFGTCVCLLFRNMIDKCDFRFD